MEEISLREIIEVLLKGKWVIIVVTLLAVFVSGVVSFFVLPAVYEAEVALNIRGGEKSPVTEVTDMDLAVLLEQLTRLPLYDMETYKYQILSHAFLENALAAMELDPEKYTPLSLQKAIKVEQVSNTSLIKIAVHDRDPQMAARIANGVAELFITEINNQNQEQISLASSYLESQLEEIEAQFTLTMEEYRVFLQKPGSVDELKEEIDSKITAVTGNKLESGYLQVALATAETERDALNKELAETPEFIITRKSITDDPLLMRVYEETGDSGMGQLAGLQMESEEPNPVYLDLLSRFKNTNVLIESTKRRIAETRSSLVNLERELETLRIAYMDKLTEQERIERELDYYRTTREVLEDNLLELQMVSSLSAEEVSFSVISPAYTPQSPVQPRKMLNMAVAGVLAVMISVFIVFLQYYWETSKDENTVPVSGAK